MSDDAVSRTSEEEALTGEIERTREQLGETIEALAAKADVKARAQRRAAEITGTMRGKAQTAREKLTERAAGLRGKALGGHAVGIVRTHRARAAAAAATAAAVLVAALLALRRLSAK